MFFKRNKPAPAAADPTPPEALDDGSLESNDEPRETDDEPEGWDLGEVDDGDAGDAEMEWRTRADAVIPGGASTGSKRAEALFGDRDEPGPAHFIAASGYTVLAANERRYADFTMALGSVALGYAEPSVVQAVVDAVANGSVSGLSSALEVEVAERLCDVIPCAESVRFLKTGAEACAAAVRIARTHTGRTRVIGSGYFGWLGWWQGGAATAGVPAGAHADYVHVPFDDVAALEAAVSDAGSALAAVILEPVVERLPSVEWIAAARAACDRTGAVLIFDEIKTGFRLATGGYHQYAKVKPDLATFGKAMANGFPLAAVVGRRDVMDAARRTWISSTLASEASALAAARAVLDWHERAEVCETLWATGGELRAAADRAITASSARGVRIDGIDPMWLFRFERPDDERRFLAASRRVGVLFKRGAYNFACLAHDDAAVALAERAASTAFVELAAAQREEGRR
jgi:glutamate-1-semialdehyde 2,1-aminomutase